MIQVQLATDDGTVVLAYSAPSELVPQQGETILVDDDPDGTSWKRYQVTGRAWNVTPAATGGAKLTYVIVWVTLMGG